MIVKKTKSAVYDNYREKTGKKEKGKNREMEASRRIRRQLKRILIKIVA